MSARKTIPGWTVGGLLVAGLALGQAAVTTTRSLGGPATVIAEGKDAFSSPSPTLSPAERRAFAVGNSFFRENWVMAPASAARRDGLGPLFSARSCSSCHVRDGRGRPPEPGDTAPTGLLLKLAPHPVYGVQLQEHAIHGATPEARYAIEWEATTGRYADGTGYELIRPRITFADWAYGDPGNELVVSPRVASHLIGLGLLESIDERTILERADPDDADGDGVSGRPNRVQDRRTGEVTLGRFGWKASQPDVEHQTAIALHQDMGITSSLHPREATTAAQPIEFVSGGDPEIDDHLLGRLAFYSRTLAVPAQRRVNDPQVRRGEALFAELRCDVCHRPSVVTSPNAALVAFRNVEIRPYTDLLLHDMGPDLADGVAEAAASGAEWRTPPLWGIGLFESVSGHTRYLHDGRARNLEEAILWHGGEAAASRDAFKAAPASDRAAVLAFLRSL